MSDAQGTALLEPAGMVEFEAWDVTGMRSFAAKVERGLPAGTVAASLAAQMLLPENVPWTLRDEDTSAYLDERKSIGEQLGPSARVTLTPKTHLG